MKFPKKINERYLFCIGSSFACSILFIILFLLSPRYSMPFLLLSKESAMTTSSLSDETSSNYSFSFSIPNPPLVFHKEWQNITFRWMTDRVIIDRKHKLSYGPQTVHISTPHPPEETAKTRWLRAFCRVFFLHSFVCHIVPYRKMPGP